MARQSAMSLLISRLPRPRLLAVLGSLLALVMAMPSWAATKVGEISFAHGLATAQLTTAPPRVVGKGSELYEGDVVTTGVRSVAILALADGTKVTLRPETIFKVEVFSTADNEGRALYRLFKGGLRAVTGFLSKRNPNAVRLQTSMATIGIRGTEFDARLCGADCAQEAKVRPQAAGHAGFIKGTVLARAAGGRARALAAGAPIYNGDSLVTGAAAYAVVAFRDRSRVTLLPNTEFRVDRLDFDEAAPDAGSGVFNLLRGGLRAVSGLIGKHNQRAYQMRTPVATIGIRGTGYDLLCQGTCVNPEPTAAPGGDGMYADVWQGAITVGEDHQVNEGDTVFLGNAGMQPLAVDTLPIEIPQPKPDSVEIPEPPPPPASSSAPDEGLYVSCYVGNCSMQTQQNTTDLKPGEAGFVGNDGGPAQPLAEIPPFQAEDPIYQAVEAGQSMNLLNGALGSGGDQCTVQ